MSLYDTATGVVLTIAIFSLLAIGATSFYGHTPWRWFWSVMATCTVVVSAVALVEHFAFGDGAGGLRNWSPSSS